MAQEQYANDYTTTLNGAIGSGDGTLVVTVATGAPAAPFRLLLQNSATDATNREYVLVTVVAGTTFTITRGLEGTSPVAHASGSWVAQDVTAGGLTQSFHERMDAASKIYAYSTFR